MSASTAAGTVEIPFGPNARFAFRFIEQLAEIVLLARFCGRGGRADAEVQIGPVGVELFRHADGVRVVLGREDDLENDGETQDNMMFEVYGQLLL